MNFIENIFVTEDVTLININNVPGDISLVSKVFESIAAAGVDVDMISGTPQAGILSGLSFTVSDENLGSVLAETAKFRELWPDLTISVSSGNAKISVFGEKMRGVPGVASKIFQAAASAHTDIRMITTSEVDISLLVTQPDLAGAVAAIRNIIE